MGFRQHPLKCGSGLFANSSINSCESIIDGHTLRTWHRPEMMLFTTGVR